MKKKQRFVKQYYKNVIILTSIADRSTFMIHIKNNKVIKNIIEKIESIKDISSTKKKHIRATRNDNSNICIYIRRNLKAKILLILYDDCMHYEMHQFINHKVANKMVNINNQIRHNILSYNVHLTPNALTRNQVFRAKIELSKARKNTSSAYFIASIAKNETINSSLFVNNVNYYTRDVNMIENDKLVSVIIYNRNFHYLQIFTACETTMLVCKQRKLDDTERITDIIQEEINILLEKHLRHKLCSSLNIPDATEDIYIYTDDEEVFKYKFQNIHSQCVMDNSFFTQNQFNDIISYLSYQSYKYISPYKIYSANIDKKKLLFKICKFFRNIMLITTLLAAIFGFREFINNNQIQLLKSYEGKIKQAKAENTKITNKKYLDVLSNINDLEKVNNDITKKQFTTLNQMTNIINIVKKHDNIHINKYNISKDEKNHIKINIFLDVANPTGYLSNAHYIITKFRNDMYANFDNMYDIKGLDFDYKFNMVRKYFKGYLTVNITEKSNNNIDNKNPDTKEKNTIEAIFTQNRK